MQTMDNATPTPPSHRKIPVVGLTGSIGSGKSAVGDLLQSHGARIIDADLLAREVVAPNSPGLAKVVSAFGRDILTSSGDLDRKKLGKLIFSDKSARKKLEEIVHPLVRELFLSQLQLFLKSPETSPIIYVVPLLFESPYTYDELDYIVVVVAPREVCLQRVQKRDGCTEAEASQRFDAQLPPSQKERGADWIIRNDGDFDRLKVEVANLFKKIAT